MDLDPDSIQGLTCDVIVSPMDLVEFKQEKIETLASNLRETKCDRINHLYQGQYDQGMTVPKLGLNFGIGL